MKEWVPDFFQQRCQSLAGCQCRVVVANLEPATLMGVQSQGMVLAGSTDGDGALAVLTLDRDLPPGARVR